MSPSASFDPLERFAEIERIAGKVYFKLSDRFLGQRDLREFWWQMAMDEEQHASVLLACKTIVDKISQDDVGAGITVQTADQLEAALRSYLKRVDQPITVDKAFEIALEMESSELDIIYKKLLDSCGPRIAKTMAKFGVTADEQRGKLKSAVLRFCMEPRLRSAAQDL